MLSFTYFGVTEKSIHMIMKFNLVTQCQAQRISPVHQICNFCWSCNLYFGSIFSFGLEKTHRIDKKCLFLFKFHITDPFSVGFPVLFFTLFSFSLPLGYFFLFSICLPSRWKTTMKQSQANYSSMDWKNKMLVFEAKIQNYDIWIVFKIRQKLFWLLL